MKRLLLLSLLLLPLLFTGLAPAAAQPDDPLDWIPAGFAGFIQIDLTNTRTTLNDLNLSLYVASVLQPARFDFSEAQGYDAFFPLENFDMEAASFTESVLPWLNDELIIAYRELGSHFDASAANTLMILPSRDAFTSATFLQQVVAAQDLLARENYHDVIVYRGDKTTFAFLPTAVLVGADDLVHTAIDTMLGSGEALTSDPVFQQVRASLPDDGLITAYLAGETAARSLSVLLSGGDSADPYLSAISQSLEQLDDLRTPERLLLSGSLDSVGVSLKYDPLITNHLEASVILHTVEAPELPDSDFDSAVLELIPRNAMLVQSGTDAASAANGALYALPLLNFASEALASFQLSQPQATTLPVATPGAEDMNTAVNGFFAALAPLVDLQGDLLEKLDGSYSIALLPRPNNPMPGLNAPFDLLLVVQTDSPESAEAAQLSASTLIETFSAPLEDEAIGAHSFHTLRAAGTDEALVRVGAVDNLLVIGTGTAAELALDAQRGDNQLIDQDRWLNLSADDELPYVYVDVNAYYNTFQPTIGGAMSIPVRQLGVQSRYLGENLFELNVVIAIRQ